MDIKQRIQDLLRLRPEALAMIQADFEPNCPSARNILVLALERIRALEATQSDLDRCRFDQFFQSALQGLAASHAAETEHGVDVTWLVNTAVRIARQCVKDPPDAPVQRAAPEEDQ